MLPAMFSLHRPNNARLLPPASLRVFREACLEHGIPIEDGDMAYYVKVVTAKVAEMTPRLVGIGLKAKGK
jgi:hypothetical protein